MDIVSKARCNGTVGGKIMKEWHRTIILVVLVVVLVGVLTWTRTGFVDQALSNF